MAINIKDENIDMGAVYITGAGFTKKKFSGFGRETMGWNETVWGGKLNRSNTFALENIDDVEIGQVPQLTIKYNYITIDDFIDLQKILKERHVIVEYFDIDLGKRVTHEMAITGNDRKQIITRGNKLIGMSNFTIKFVAITVILEFTGCQNTDFIHLGLYSGNMNGVRFNKSSCKSSFSGLFILSIRAFFAETSVFILEISSASSSFVKGGGRVSGPLT